MSRLDICPNLIHFTNDVSDEAAFQRLQKIVREKTLLGTGRLIKGDFSCVRFSEAPLTSLSVRQKNSGLNSLERVLPY
jgi:hypothetical protein